jgi:hypothetical protein
MLDDGGTVAEQPVQRAAQEVGHCRRCAAIGNLLKLYARRGLEQHEAEMRHRAERGNGERDLAGSLARQCGEIDCGLNRQSRVHNQHR